MTHVLLRLERNSQTGLPRLTIEGIELPRGEQAALERELHQRFGELAAKAEGDLFEIRMPLRQLPRPAQFRVKEVSHVQSRRCPDVVLELVQLLSQNTEQQGLFRWDEFRIASRNMLGRVPASRRDSLQQIVDEFSRLENASSQKQLLTIFSGYLLLQRVFCDQEQRMRRALLDDAIEAIATAFAGKNPQGPAPAEQAKSPPALRPPVGRPPCTPC